MKIPKQWVLITLYMALVYCVILGLMHYAKTHPIVDDHVRTPMTQDAVPLPAPSPAPSPAAP